MGDPFYHYALQKMSMDIFDEILITPEETEGNKKFSKQFSNFLNHLTCLEETSHNYIKILILLLHKLSFLSSYFYPVFIEF